MRNYWSCTKFADWVRGTPKGGAKTSEGWHNWNEDAKRYNPVRYWIAEELLDRIQGFFLYIPDRLNDVRYYINNRWVTKSHALTAHPRDIKPGKWQDLGNRFLPCLFNELVDFVEVEQAWHTCIWNEEARKKYAVPWWRSGWLRWRTWRCPEAGLDYLDWAMTLTNEEFLDDNKKHLAEPTHQAKAAKEIKELYTWWTQTYRNRPDPMDASGWTAYCELSRLQNGGRLSFSGEDKTPEMKKASKLALKELRKIEAAYEKEDTEMLIRLIKIRQSLWT
jgi:hypothetical protein